MKTISYFLVLLLLSFSCTQKPSASEGWDALSGVFVNGEDTLKIEANIDFNMIGFDVTSQNELQWKTVFDDAEHLEATGKSEKFIFQDSSEYTFEDLIFTYSYSKDTWEIEDLVYQKKRDSNRVTDLSGIYQRVK